MKKTCYLLSLLFTLILSNPSEAGAALNGDYTIGGSSPDYATISLAVTDLVNDGISGPVNFLIRNGTYNEQVTISAFQRFGSSTDRVTFTKSGPLEDVYWIYSGASAGNNWILKLDGADYITFLELNFNAVIQNFGDMVYFEGASHNITFESNLFDGIFGIGDLILQNKPGNYTNTRFISNVFSQGDIAIDFDYIFGGADSTGVEIRGNTFINQSSKALESGSDGLIVFGNTVSTANTSNNDYVGFDIKDRFPQIENNMFDMLSGATAILAVGDGIGFESLIANNMISMRHTSATTAGINVDIENVSVFHNTVRSASASAPALLISGGVDVRIQNNILIKSGGGISLEIYNQSAITKTDYNIIYSTGNPLVSITGSSYNSLASYRLGTGLDSNSKELNVNFMDTVGINDLHLAAPDNNNVDLLAPPSAEVTTDFDGDTRGEISVYKGADEGIAIVSLDNGDTASGFYTVGGSNPDYLTPTSAIVDLKQRGMKGPVTFEIRAGFYTTHQTLAEINRSGNSDDQLVFRAADFNNPPTLRYNTNSAVKNHVIKIQNMGDVSFDHINFSTSASDIYGNLLVIEGDSDNISVRNGIFTGVTGQTVETTALIQATELGVDNYEFIGNQFINGSIALNLIPSSVFTSPKGQGLIIESNFFSQQTVHALLTNHDDIDFNSNEISNSLDGFEAILIRFNQDTQIGKNKFLLAGLNSTAINLEGADGASTSNPNIFSNNFIKSAIGIQLNRGSHTIEIYYNTIVASVLPITINDAINDSHDINLVNNIIQNNGSGPAVFISANDTVNESDFNNFINISGILLDWEGSQYSSLSAFQNATVFDSRSTNTPVFFNDIAIADLHLVQSSIGDQSLTGTPISLVEDDYDSQMRTIVSPYMGADQVLNNPIINTYSVGGNISGLAIGNTVSLTNSNGDVLLNQSNGEFTFSIQPNDGDAYNVTVSDQPTVPNQTCSVTNGSGNLSGEDISTINIICLTNFYLIGGTVTGLTPGNSVSLQNNIADNTVISNNGAYAFSTLIENGSTYSVTVLSPPDNPRQSCTISNAASTVSNASVSNVDVNCITQTYSVGGNVSGLTQGNSLELQNNNGDNLIVNGNGGFTFATETDSNSSYSVTVVNQPSKPQQICSVSNGIGDINSFNITNVQISCSTDRFTIGGTVTGLVSGNSVTLQNSSVEIAHIFDNGVYTFSTQLENSATYNISVLVAPSNPHQLCTVSNASGAILGQDIVNIDVNCITETYTVGGNVSGLIQGNSLELQNNNGDNLLISSNGGFTFLTELDSNSSYSVTVLNQSNTPEQDCIISNAIGDINTADITSVQITCISDEFSIGGTVTGLATGNSMVLRNNDDELEVFTNGSFTFVTPVGDGIDYNVTVFSQPNNPIQTCLVSNASSTVSNSNVTNVDISCITNTFSVGGSVSGLVQGNSLEIQNNNTNTLLLSTNGDFVFVTELNSNSSYSVTVVNQPNSPVQDCKVSGGEGEINDANIINVNIVCDNLELIFSNGFELINQRRESNQDEPNNDKLNKLISSGTQAPQVIPSLNVFALILLVFGFLIIVRVRYNKYT